MTDAIFDALAGSDVLIDFGRFLKVEVSEDEMILWQNLLPAAAERCRHSWTHQGTCEYLVERTILLRTDLSGTSLCSCGEGKDLSAFPGGGWEIFSKYATRIALTPLSPVPYVEKLLIEHRAGDRMVLLGMLGTQAASGNPGPCLPSGTSASAEKCDNCKTEKKKLKSCQRCMKVKYCNHDCQKAAWKQHKKICGKK